MNLIVSSNVIQRPVGRSSSNHALQRTAAPLFRSDARCNLDARFTSHLASRRLSLSLGRSASSRVSRIGRIGFRPSARRSGQFRRSCSSGTHRHSGADTSRSVCGSRESFCFCPFDFAEDVRDLVFVFRGSADFLNHFQSRCVTMVGFREYDGRRTRRWRRRHFSIQFVHKVTGSPRPQAAAPQLGRYAASSCVRCCRSRKRKCRLGVPEHIPCVLLASLWLFCRCACFQISRQPHNNRMQVTAPSHLFRVRAFSWAR